MGFNLQVNKDKDLFKVSLESTIELPRYTNIIQICFQSPFIKNDLNNPDVTGGK